MKLALLAASFVFISGCDWGINDLEKDIYRADQACTGKFHIIKMVEDKNNMMEKDYTIMSLCEYIKEIENKARLHALRCTHIDRRTGELVTCHVDVKSSELGGLTEARKLCKEEGF